jgi:hypothetical protein
MEGNMMKKLLLTITLVLVASLAHAKVPVCVNAYQLETQDEQGFLIEGVVKAQEAMDDSARDLAKQVKKSKVMEYTEYCDMDTMKLTVIYRGWKKSGQLDFYFNHIGQYLDVHEVNYRALVVMLEIPYHRIPGTNTMGDEVNKSKTKTFKVVMDPYKVMVGMMGWSGMAKDIKKQVDKFLKLNGLED